MTWYCEKCRQTMNSEEFYVSNNLEKYPSEGRMNQCKKCMTLRVDNWDPNTYLWILEEIDVPYVPDEWNKLLAAYAKDRSKLTGMTILGRYLSKMKLKQFRDYRWEHTEHLQEIANKKIEETMKRQGYDAVEIAQAVSQASVPIPAGILEQPIYNDDPFKDQQVDDYFAEINGDTSDLGNELTDEDRTYLRLKWGKTYKPEEWVRLEQLYEEMMASYDVQGAGHVDILKLVCKTSLKANQLIDIGDIEGFQKMSKVYDSLMKSGKFTAQQNKEEGEFIDSIGELVELCEKQGYIERFYIDKPNDKVDATIQDMQRYTRTLIEKETNLGEMIEAAMKQNAREDAKVSDDLDIVMDDNVDEIEEIEKIIHDKDFEEFNEFIDGEMEEDFLNSIKGRDI